MMISRKPPGAAARKSFAGLALLPAILTLVLAGDASVAAQKLVDPDSVAPEYRAAAEKRRAEQLRMLQCSKKADEAKVPKRDRAAHISACIDNAAAH
jgi:hypothetical protein